MDAINWESEKEYIKNRKNVTEILKKIIVNSLNLDINHNLIQEDQPLFGRGLELDSIDALELSLNISKEFNVEINDNDADIWSSINCIADFIMENSDEYRNK